jgi:hypothetical protein
MNYNKLIIKKRKKDRGREWRMNVPGEGVAAGEEADGDGGGERRGKAVVWG